MLQPMATTGEMRGTWGPVGRWQVDRPSRQMMGWTGPSGEKEKFPAGRGCLKLRVWGWVGS